MKNTVGQLTPSFGVAKLHDYKKRDAFLLLILKNTLF